MALFSIYEIIDIVIITVALGYIFKDFIPKRNKKYDPLKQHKFDYHHFLYAAAIVAPVIILHEFGHKFVAMAFGATAEFHAAYGFLALGIILKLLNFGFIFFVPAYVAWSGSVTNLQVALVAAAGPIVNALLWAIAIFFIKTKRLTKYHRELIIFAKINGFIAIFNMIPIPGFDGFHVLTNLIGMI